MISINKTNAVSKTDKENDKIKTKVLYINGYEVTLEYPDDKEIFQRELENLLIEHVKGLQV